jgi:hypothetical protein
MEPRLECFAAFGAPRKVAACLLFPVNFAARAEPRKAGLEGPSVGQNGKSIKINILHNLTHEYRGSGQAEAAENIGENTGDVRAHQPKRRGNNGNSIANRCSSLLIPRITAPNRPHARPCRSRKRYQAMNAAATALCSP